MRASPFRSAFVVAAGVHGGLIGLTRLAIRPVPEAIHTAPAPELFVVDEEPPAELAPPALEPAAATTPGVPARGRIAVATTGAPAPVTPAASTDDLSTPELPPVPAPSAAPSAVAHVDLGLGSYWKTVALGAPATLDLPTSRPPPSPSAVLREALETHDRAIGLGSAGPLVSAAHEAASPAVAPDTGVAIFDVACDASGGGVTVHVVSAAGALPAWDDVAREIERLMASKHMRVPPDARGVRTRLEIRAERALPSGEKRTTSAGAVPDDIPGGDKACVGEGSERRCAAGLPVGTTQTIGDLSNIGAKRSRIVHVKVLGEVTL